MTDPDRHARTILMQAVFERGFAEPMTILKLAQWFQVGRNKMSRILRRMPGVERCGSLYRVPIRKMPPGYWALHLSQICTDLHDSDSEESED